MTLLQPITKRANVEAVDRFRDTIAKAKADAEAELAPLRELSQSALKGAMAVERMDKQLADERADDAKNLRLYAKDPNLTHIDKFFMCNIVTRNKMLGNLTQAQVDRLPPEDLADVIEGLLIIAQESPAHVQINDEGRYDVRMYGYHVQTFDNKEEALAEMTRQAKREKQYAYK